MYFDRNIGYHLSRFTQTDRILTRKEGTQKSWQQQLSEGFCEIDALCRHLNIASTDLPNIEDIRQFPLKVPLSFVERMERGNPEDPLLRQVIPLHDEMSIVPGFSPDPVGDLNAIAEQGVLQKYRRRALLILTGACAINCRYCFRRNFPYGENQLTPKIQEQALAYISSQKDISEIILSGGDPLLLNDAKISALFQSLGEIPHLSRIRIHSRLPVVLPARIDNNLLDIFKRSRKKIVLVLHANHSRELSSEVECVCKSLASCGVTLLNQSVLLRGVNDSAIALCELSERLFSIGVLPYYLHLLDKAQGTAHFDVEADRAIRLMLQIKTQLPGYLVPKLVKEVAGAPNKLTLC